MFLVHVGGGAARGASSPLAVEKCPALSRPTWPLARRVVVDRKVAGPGDAIDYRVEVVKGGRQGPDGSSVVGAVNWRTLKLQ